LEPIEEATALYRVALLTFDLSRIEADALGCPHGLITIDLEIVRTDGMETANVPRLPRFLLRGKTCSITVVAVHTDFGRVREKARKKLLVTPINGPAIG
jgi:hypothetical protein